MSSAAPISTPFYMRFYSRSVLFTHCVLNLSINFIPIGSGKFTATLANIHQSNSFSDATELSAFQLINWFCKDKKTSVLWEQCEVYNWLLYCKAQLKCEDYQWRETWLHHGHGAYASYRQFWSVTCSLWRMNSVLESHFWSNFPNFKATKMSPIIQSCHQKKTGLPK